MKIEDKWEGRSEQLEFSVPSQWRVVFIEEFFGRASNGNERKFFLKS